MCLFPGEKMINIIHEEKVTAIILMRKKNSFYLLVFKMNIGSNNYYRLPGGGVDHNENPRDAVYREIQEESGIPKTDLTYIRKIGKLEYYKPHIHKQVKMNNYLFFYNKNDSKRFSFEVKSSGKDNGLIFNYEWANSKAINKIDPELRQLINPYNLPELYIKPKYYGLKKKKIEIVSTNHEWNRLYEFEEIEIRTNIKNIKLIEHIGSTSIPDFIAKPILDILLILPAGKIENEIIQKIINNGYSYFKEKGIPGRHYFTKESGDYTYIHLHVFEENHKHAAEHLKVKKVLTDSKEWRNKYRNYKKRNKGKTRLEYTEKKDEIMYAILGT